MANPLTQVRQAIEGLFIGRIETVVEKVLKYDKASAVDLFGSPRNDVRRCLRVDPNGGPINPYYTAGSWLMTREFLIVINLPERNMDVGELETIELAVLGCLAIGVQTKLALACVQAFRPISADYAVYSKRDPAGKGKNRPVMWVCVGKVEVDMKITQTEIEQWAPAAT